MTTSLRAAAALHKEIVAMSTLFQSELSSLPPPHRGKVRDIYDVDAEHLLIVATDRLSAFDVVLPTPIPEKGRILTTMSNFWCAYTSHIVPNHLTTRRLEDCLSPQEAEDMRDRAVIVRRITPLPVEAIVRGYLTGSGWAEYQRQGTVCDLALPQGLRESERLPEPIFTPSTKAPQGEHDINISFEALIELLAGNTELAERLWTISLQLYQEVAAYAWERGIIIADTKFEFGLLQDTLYLIDEAFTPDSSRFWPRQSYVPGQSQPSYDKQYVRDYLTSLGWDKRPPAPSLPPHIVQQTTQKYREALQALMGSG
jgi:phosphoribosylaminoimidazole-succinocarboxamide synthase